jgi:hypothetical protein
VRRIGLEAPLGRVVAQVHLGQSRGFRAVRILPTDAEETGAAHVPHRLAPRTEGQDLLPDLAEMPRGTPGLPDVGLPDLGLPGGGLPSLGLPPLQP